jgi:hypothetical protein
LKLGVLFDSFKGNLHMKSTSSVPRKPDISHHGLF